jgi:nucleoside-diphosphate-sugar epimerase/predicted RNase H-like nuclease
VADTRFIGVDLAWREGNGGLLANETGVAVIDGDGRILDAGWTRGVEQTVGWAAITAGDGDALMFVDAPLVVRNETGQRLCETQVGQRYGRWKVSANTTNIHSPRLAGVQFLRRAGLSGWRYSDGSDGPERGGRVISETYPYATLVGAAELGYDTERPRYKRKPPRLPAAQWRTERAANCDTLIRRLERLADADPPLLLRSHPVTRELAEQASPVGDSAYKHREDLIDALLCAWTASLWAGHGFDHCQVLGLPADLTGNPAATMIVPARPEQRRQPLAESALSAAEVEMRRGQLASFSGMPVWRDDGGMRVLITGDRGHVGVPVVGFLRSCGYEVAGFDLAGGADVLDLAAVRRAARGCAAIVHLAALAHDSAGRPEQIMAVNVLGTWHVLLAAEAAGAGRVIVFSTAQVFGIAGGERLPDYFPVDDAHPRRAARPYGLSKRLAEDLCEGFTARTGIATVCLRPVAVWGQAQYARVADRWRARPESEWEPFWEYGAFVDVRDVAAAVRQALTVPLGGHHRALLCAAGIAATASSLELAARLAPAVPVTDPGRYRADPWAALIDCSTAAATLGWQPAHRWSYTETHARP